MEKTVKFIGLLCLFLGSSTVFAQAEIIKFSEGVQYLESNLYFKESNRIIKTEYLVIKAGQVIYKKPFSSHEETVPIADLKMIRTHSGTHALEYGLYGGVIMALSALLAVVDANAELESDGYGRVDGSPIVIVLTLVGAGTGGLLGSFSDKWEVIYFSE